MALKTYQIVQPSKIIFGAGAVNSIASEVYNLKVKRILIVTDSGVYQAGLVNPIEEQLIRAGFDVDVYHDSELEPTVSGIDRAAGLIGSGKYELLIGVGGGSSIDTAKSLSVLLAHGGKAQDYLGVNIVPGPGIPLIAIPTTAGTGSEATNVAVLSNEEKQLKQGVVSHYLLANVAIVDPVLSYCCPTKITAASGIDALVHGIESYTSIKANSFTDAIALQSMRLIIGSLKRSVRDGSDTLARADMAEGALLAGIAFGNAGVAAVHALAYPLGARFHTSHGIANGLLLPYVMECNYTADPAKYSRIAQIMGENTERLAPERGAELGIACVKNLISSIGIPSRVRDLGVPREALEGMATATMINTRILSNNPKELTLDDVRGIWNKAW